MANLCPLPVGSNAPQTAFSKIRNKVTPIIIIAEEAEMAPFPKAQKKANLQKKNKIITETITLKLI